MGKGDKNKKCLCREHVLGVAAWQGKGIPGRHILSN